MALPTDLQFLDLNNATVDEVEHIKNILFGPNKKSLVEFPWQTGEKCCGCEANKSADDCTTDVLGENQHELATPQVAANVLYHEMPEQEPPLMPHIMCVNSACNTLQGNTLMVTTGMPMSSTGMQAEFMSVQPSPPPHMLVSPHSLHTQAVPPNTEIMDKNRGRKVKKRVSDFSRIERDLARNDGGNVITYQDQHMPVPIPMNTRVTIPQAMVTQPIGYSMTLAPPNMQPVSYQFYSQPMMYASPHMYNFVPSMYSSYPANFMGPVAVSNDLAAVQNNCTMHLTPCEVPQDVYDDKKPVPENLNFCQENCIAEPQVPPSENTMNVMPNEQLSEEKPSDDCEKKETTESQNITQQIIKTKPAGNSNDEVIIENSDNQVETNEVNHTETLIVDSSNKPEDVEVNPITNATSTLTERTVSIPPVVKSEVKDSTNNREGAIHKTWASLFEKSNKNVYTNLNTESRPSNLTVNNRKTVLREKSVTVNVKPDVVHKKVITGIGMSKDSFPTELKEFLSTIQLEHHSVHIVPRGLTNSGNWCYINATLQALLACPPFFNLMRKLPVVAGLKAKNSSAIPVIDSMVEFFHEFVPLPNLNKTFKTDVKLKDDFMCGKPFEPKYVYQMLRAIKLESFKGKQEDAEEFLSCILNRLHEEMLEIISAANLKNNKLKNGEAVTTEKPNHSTGDDESDWLVMGYKNKSCITREVKCTPSPIFDIFGGTMRSMLQQAGSKNSATLQPFFTLQLDIQSETVTCIRTALDGLVVKESLQGFTSANSRQEIEASRKITLEKLPVILILHLKRFVFDRNGGCRKLLKRVDFGIDLELNLLSSVGKSVHKQRRYRLFAVVYHDGQELAKGHYTTDVFHAGYKSWLRADDSNIHQISEANVMKHSPPRVPYLLYYRNVETIP
uniref:Ubiquitin carboxyl-terminal hydrolase n=1 Tax=Strigamia maritima TaxID=126957 RepID=T1J495_STRMM